MADDNNQASVELDTDGVNEETIHVETPTEEASAFEKKEDVDLGYTDVTNPKSAKELLQEVKKTEEKTKPKFEQREEDTDSSDLEDYSEKVQKRIKKLIALCTRYDYASFKAGSLSFNEDDIKIMSPKYFLEKDPSNNERILIAHCKDDERIPFHNLQLIKDQLDLSEKNVIVYETGGHSFRGNRENLFNEAIRFLERD